MSPSRGGFDGGRSAAGGVTVGGLEGSTSTTQQPQLLQSSIPASVATSRLHDDADDVDTTVTSEVAMTTHTVPPPRTESQKYISNTLTTTTTSTSSTAATSVPSHGPNTIVGNSWAQPRLVEINRKEGEHLGISIVGAYKLQSILLRNSFPVFYEYVY